MQLFKVYGIGPMRWLLFAIKFWSEPLWHKFWGKRPVNWFVSNCSTTNFMRFPISWGMGPESWLPKEIGTLPFNWFFPSWRLVMNFKFPNTSRMVPESLLSYRCKKVGLRSVHNDVGIELERLFLSSLKEMRDFEFPIYGGM